MTNKSDQNRFAQNITVCVDVNGLIWYSSLQNQLILYKLVTLQAFFFYSPNLNLLRIQAQGHGM